jgi:hypothetical protein
MLKHQLLHQPPQYTNVRIPRRDLPITEEHQECSIRLAHFEELGEVDGDEGLSCACGTGDPEYVGGVAIAVPGLVVLGGKDPCACSGGSRPVGGDEMLAVAEGVGTEEGLEAVLMFSTGGDGGFEGEEVGGDVDAAVSGGVSMKGSGWAVCWT